MMKISPTRRSSLTGGCIDTDIALQKPSSSSSRATNPKPLLGRSVSVSSLQSSTSPTDQESLSSFDDSFHESFAPSTAPPCRAVHFDLSYNQAYSSVYVIIDDTSRMEQEQEGTLSVDEHDQDSLLMSAHQTCLWYLQEDAYNFRKQAHSEAHKIFQLCMESSCQTPQDEAVVDWCRGLWTAFTQLEEAMSSEQIKKVINRRVPAPDACVGLEKWAIPRLRHCKTRQRCNMYRAVRDAELYPSLSYTKQSQQLRRIVRLYTRPNRLFAMYVGRSVQAGAREDSS